MHKTVKENRNVSSYILITNIVYNIVNTHLILFLHNNIHFSILMASSFLFLFLLVIFDFSIRLEFQCVCVQDYCSL